MIQNLIFDFDGVLVDSEIIAGRAFSRYLAKYNITFTEQEFSSTYAGNKTINVVSDLASKFDIKEKEIFFKEVMIIANDIYNRDLTTTKGIVNVLDNFFYNNLIGSNSPKNRIIKGLKKVNLIKYFMEKNIFSYDMVTNPKPYPDVYLRAVEIAKLQPKETIIIEDSVVGVKAAIAAKIKVIGLTSGGHWIDRSSQLLLDHGASAVAKNYKELINIISEL